MADSAAGDRPEPGAYARACEALATTIGDERVHAPRAVRPRRRRRPGFRRLAARRDALPRGRRAAPRQRPSTRDRTHPGALPQSPTSPRLAAPVPEPLSHAIMAALGRIRPTAHGRRARARAAAAGGRPARQAAAGAARADPRVSFRSWRCPTHMSMHPADTYLRLAEGPDDLLSNQVSLTRRLLTLCVAVVLFVGQLAVRGGRLRSDRRCVRRQGDRLVGLGQGRPRRRGPLRSAVAAAMTMTTPTRTPATPTRTRTPTRATRTRTRVTRAPAPTRAPARRPTTRTRARTRIAAAARTRAVTGARPT